MCVVSLVYFNLYLFKSSMLLVLLFCLSPLPFLCKHKWGDPTWALFLCSTVLFLRLLSTVSGQLSASTMIIRAAEHCWRKITVGEFMSNVQLAVSYISSSHSVSCDYLCVSQIRAFYFKYGSVSFKCSFFSLILYYFE